MSEFTPKTPITDKWEDPAAIEDSLEREAPSNDRRDRYSKEYAGLANNSIEASEPETDIAPDGRETYPEGDDFLRARGENIAGSKVVEGDDEQAQMMETPDSEGYASDWKGSEAASEEAARKAGVARAQHPAPDKIEDDEPKERHIPPANPDRPSGR